MNFKIRPVWAEVNLDNIESNIRNIKKYIGSKKLIAVVKADAYGHGATDVAPILLENGADELAVAVITEAIELRENNILAPILILGYTPIAFSKDLVKYNLQQTVYDLEYAKGLSQIAKEEDKIIEIHIALDTGMGRIGFLPTEESVDAVEEISKLDNIKIKGMFTHFATADEKDKGYTKEQINKYKFFLEKLEIRGIDVGTKHLSNSAAILDVDECYYDGVRPGIILYGYYPSKEVNCNKIKIKPALTLKSNIVHVKRLPKGEYISYGRKFKTEKESIIATLPIGYADGYTRALFGKAKVIINGELAPVVGKICMDQCMVDVSNIANVSVGDEVILIGEENGRKFNADDIANAIDTISYEVICMIGKRVPRVYIKNNEIVKMRNYV